VFAAAPLGVVAATETTGHGKGPSCAGVISRAPAHQQQRDDANEFVMFIAEIPGFRPGR